MTSRPPNPPPSAPPGTFPENLDRSKEGPVNIPRNSASQVPSFTNSYY